MRRRPTIPLHSLKARREGLLAHFSTLNNVGATQYALEDR